MSDVITTECACCKKTRKKNPKSSFRTISNFDSYELVYLNNHLLNRLAEFCTQEIRQIRYGNFFFNFKIIFF